MMKTKYKILLFAFVLISGIALYSNRCALATSWRTGQDGCHCSSTIYSNDATIGNNLEVGNNLVVGGNITGSRYGGEIYYNNDTATEINFAVDSQYYQLFMTNTSRMNGMGFEGGYGIPSNLTIENTGWYRVGIYALGDGQNNHHYTIMPFINETGVEKCRTSKTLSSGTDLIPMSRVCDIYLHATDRLSLRVADIGATGTGNYYESSLIASYVGD